MRSLSRLESRRMDDRERQIWGRRGDEGNGIFLLKAPGGRITAAGQSGQRLYCIASNGEGWEHVSVSVPNTRRCPTWEEMAFVKDQFWHPDECVIQYHPPDDQYVNTHPYTLHLWRPLEFWIPVPPRELVGL